MAKVGTPTDVQALAWPLIADGEHVLVSAPTGSGKTLTAFLWAINCFVTGKYPMGKNSVLYISPLKALNNDIRCNLLKPLEELRQLFADEGVEFPVIRVMTRSGDTSAEERRVMMKKPPEIFITTPETLNIMLTSRGGQGFLSSVKTVILDEIHAVIENRRGVHLITAVERLVRFSGEFQRIAISATIKPVTLAAEFAGGYIREGDIFTPRKMVPVVSARKKNYQLQVNFAGRESDDTGRLSIWPDTVRQCKEIINHNDSTLLFTNTRRLAETITWMINADEPELLAYAHHGSLSREIRAEVEMRMKQGRLKAIVATNSLELGIDIGALDEVVLIQSPFSISSAIQRIGRAGHQVGETSRGTFFNTHAMDLLVAAVLAKSIPIGDIENTRKLFGPLDVLSQVIASMVAADSWDIDELYLELQRSAPYHNLPRRQFDLIIAMLAGKYAETRIRELSPRVMIDPIENKITGKPGTAQMLYFTGGTIPDRGYYHLRHADTGALLGELDEEYVWEASIGQHLSFGTQNWRIASITNNDVFATPVAHQGRQAPFWKAEDMGRSFHFSSRIAEFLEQVNELTDKRKITDLLIANYFMTPHSAEELANYLHEQREFTGTSLPHRHNIIIEHVDAAPDKYPGNQIVIHTMWGGQVNRPFALAITAAWQKKFGEKPELFVSDNLIYLMMPQEIDGAELLSMVTVDNIDKLLRSSLENSGFFGARFRECAGRAMLFTRKKMNQRMPLWVTRLKSKRLMESVMKYPDFPILLETWRTCMNDEFDLAALYKVLAEISTGEITWNEINSISPSPFARTMAWRQVNKYMYEDDTPQGAVRSMLTDDLLQELLHDDKMRPTISDDIITDFISKRQRTAPGYAPASAAELLDWTSERLLIPADEWQTLLAAMSKDGNNPHDFLPEIADKIAIIKENSAVIYTAVWNIPRINEFYKYQDVTSLSGRLIDNKVENTDEPDPAEILGEWLSFYGPITVNDVCSKLGLPLTVLMPALDELTDSNRVIYGSLTGNSESYCDAASFTILMRMARAARPSFTPLPAKYLPLFMANWQHLDDNFDIEDILSQLNGYPARANMWEEEILPERIANYNPAEFDNLIAGGGWHWMGTGKGKISFVDDEALSIMATAADAKVKEILSTDGARYPLHALTVKTGLNMPMLTERLWKEVWAGKISNDSLATLRKGIQTDFKPPEVPESNNSRRVPRGAFNRWSASTPFVGNWYILQPDEYVDDPIEAGEIAKEKVRVLMKRYGLLFRELLEHELPSMQWSQIFRALRLLELAGEISAGSFFEGINGLQFINHTALRKLQQKNVDTDDYWWINACDPASLAGITGISAGMPRRLPGNYICYQGTEIITVIQKGGKEITIIPKSGSMNFNRIIAPITHIMYRRVNPVLKVVVEKINGENPCNSPYLDDFRKLFDVTTDYNRLFLARKMGR
ncbi:MAG: DEAD/DEAH box helicase [bacterium]